MNPSEPRPNRPPPEWLAGYADGELDDTARQSVEEWLHNDPDARAELTAQQALSPRNELFWKSAAPSLPDDSTWAAVNERVARGAIQSPPTPAKRSLPRSWWITGALALAATAAVIVVNVVTLDSPERTTAFHIAQLPALPDDVDGLDPVFRVASNDDIDIISMPEAATALLVVGRHPLGETEVKVAAFDDVDIRAVSPDPRGEFPELHMTPHGVSGPMIWPAPREER